MTDYNKLVESGIDLRHQAPDIEFKPTEQVLEVSYPKIQFPEKHLSTLRAVMNLTGVARAVDIGANGPSVAANVTEVNRDTKELRFYEVFFPRDAHVVAYFLDQWHPELTKATVLESLKYTGIRPNLRTDGPKDEQELGKIPHEVRNLNEDKIAMELAEYKDWDFPYYGAVDTTVKNVLGIVRSAKREPEFLNDDYHGLDKMDHKVEEGLRANINWIRGRMDLNKEGLVECLAMNPKHHANQTWPDSPTSFHHKDGTWARHHPEKNWGVASVELQAEVYDALAGTAELYTSLLAGANDERKKYLEQEIDDLNRRATKLKAVIFEHFWVDDPESYGGYFARGTDRDENGNLAALEIRSSDMGYLLDSRLLEGDDVVTKKMVESTVRNLFSTEMLSLSGFRTLSSDSLLYNEDYYHNGNSWPKVTYKISLGLEKHGLFGLAREAQKRTLSLYETTKILPEYGSGSNDPSKRLVNRKIVVFDSSINPEPIIYYSIHQLFQLPQEIQAWTAAAILAIKYKNGQRIFKKGTIIDKAQQPEKVILEQGILSSIKAGSMAGV